MLDAASYASRVHSESNPGLAPRQEMAASVKGTPIIQCIVLGLVVRPTLTSVGMLSSALLAASLSSPAVSGTASPGPLFSILGGKVAVAGRSVVWACSGRGAAICVRVFSSRPGEILSTIDDVLPYIIVPPE